MHCAWTARRPLSGQLAGAGAAGQACSRPASKAARTLGGCTCTCCRLFCCCHCTARPRPTHLIGPVACLGTRPQALDCCVHSSFYSRPLSMQLRACGSPPGSDLCQDSSYDKTAPTIPPNGEDQASPVGSSVAARRHQERADMALLLLLLPQPSRQVPARWTTAMLWPARKQQSMQAPLTQRSAPDAGCRCAV